MDIVTSTLLLLIVAFLIMGLTIGNKEVVEQPPQQQVEEADTKKKADVLPPAVKKTESSLSAAPSPTGTAKKKVRLSVVTDFSALDDSVGADRTPHVQNHNVNTSADPLVAHPPRQVTEEETIDICGLDSSKRKLSISDSLFSPSAADQPLVNLSVSSNPLNSPEHSSLYREDSFEWIDSMTPHSRSMRKSSSLQGSMKAAFSPNAGPSAGAAGGGTGPVLKRRFSGIPMVDVQE